MRKDIPTIEINDDDYDYICETIKHEISRAIEGREENYDSDILTIEGEDITLEVRYDFRCFSEQATYDYPGAWWIETNIKVGKAHDSDGNECHIEQYQIDNIEAIADEFR